MEKLNDIIKETDFPQPVADGGEKGGDGDFTGEDGLLVCGRCGKPKQKKLTFPWSDEPHIVRIPCECEERAEQERQEREERAKRKAKADRMRDECFPASGFYRDCTFETDDGLTPVLSRACERFADSFDPSDHYGLMLWGDVGTGKSFMSSAIANRVIDRGFSAFQTDVRYIVNLMESSFEHRQRNLDRILGYDLLLIEDLGAQRDTPYMMEHVYAVIDGRYKTGKPMVITTNFDGERIASISGDSAWGRIFDRILERCYPVEFSGENRRAHKKEEMRKAMTERLFRDAK